MLLQVEVRYGTKYTVNNYKFNLVIEKIELNVNVTIPELSLDEDCLDFQRVLIN